MRRGRRWRQQLRVLAEEEALLAGCNDLEEAYE
jgi:hypothetical protein